MREAIGARGPGRAPLCPESERAFLGVAALLFAVAAALTVAWCGSMPAMPMCGPAPAMAWTRMPGQGWIAAAVRFLGLWAVMTAAMMLPALLPMLRRYRRAIHAMAGPRLHRLTALASLAYWCVWIAPGAAVFCLGMLLARMEMRWPALIRAAPLAAALVLLAAAALQFSDWKRRYLARCRRAPVRCLRATDDAAWRHGLRMGLDCVRSCAGLTAVLVVLGSMDLRVMAGVTAAVSLERLAPRDLRVAQVVGIALIAAGLLQLLRATGPA